MILKGCSKDRGVWLSGSSLFDRKLVMVVAVSFLFEMRDEQV